MKYPAALLFLSAVAAATDSSASELPGARPIIDASKFATIQEALNAIPEGGGLVRLPAGNFEIAEPLVLHRGDVKIEGSGTATHIINRNEKGKPALILSHPDGHNVKRDDRLWRIQLSDFRITGNPKSGHGIEAIQIEEIFLQGLTVSRNGGDGIRLDKCYEDPRVSDCLITYNGSVGVNLLGCHDIVVSACQFEENKDALHCSDGFNLCMTGNCVDDHLDRGVLIENTYGSVLSGNMIEECMGTAVTLARDCYGITLSANVIAHNGSGIDLQDAHGCAVSANTFTIMKEFALKIGPESGRITVTGNNFSDSFIGNNKVRRQENDRSAGGVILEGTTDIALTGNVFSGLTGKPIDRQKECRHIIEQGNVVVPSSK